MLRQLSMIRRAATPKKVFVSVVLCCVGYLALHQNTRVNYPSHFEGSSASETKVKVKSHPQQPSLQNASVGIVVNDQTEKELENSRQTLHYLTVDVAMEKQTQRPTPKTIKPGSVCPEVAEVPDLMGCLPQAVLLIQNLKEGEVAAAHPDIAPGGHWSPTDCSARHKVAIIIPYRDRQSHLTRLLAFLLPILQRQRLDFRFIVTEQWGNDLFNKGRIMNAAFRLAERLKVDCVIFHDVDMFPQDDRNPYSCPPKPRHLGAFVSNLGYQLWYKELVGGVLAISMDDYRAVNGYSNMYWAWGGEDDDMGQRILSLNYTIERPIPEVGRMSMLKHQKRKRTSPKLVYSLLGTSAKRMSTDGVSETDKWKIVKVVVRPLYYHMYVDVGPVPMEWRANGTAKEK